MNFELFPTSGAIFSPCRTYRYRLWRGLAPKFSGYLVVCGLNPSTADETTNDPTIRRCLDFAKQWGFSDFMMLNAFAFRSTDPEGLLPVADPVGPETDRHIVAVSVLADRFVFAWGKHERLKSILPARGQRVMELVRQYARGEIGTFGANGDGSPKHPLYLAKTTAFVPEAQP